MATKNQTMELARNIIAELDREIKTAKNIIEMVQTNEMYEGELRHHLVEDWNSHKRTLENLRDFVIYKA